MVLSENAVTLIAFLAQINPTVGDVRGNVRRVRVARQQAAASGAAVVITPELVLAGYPPEDLIYRPAFLDLIASEIEALAAETRDGGPALLVGAPWRMEGQTFNAALLLESGRIEAVIRKRHLPNYGVFDEARVFAPGPRPDVVAFRGHRLGVMICEDMWFPDVAEALSAGGAEALVVLNGSPFESDKAGQRLAHARARAESLALPLLYVNQVGGQDELVFDGASFVLSAQGDVRASLPAWVEAGASVALHRHGDRLEVTDGPRTPPSDPLADIYQAMVLGLRDYVTKNGFPGVLLGLSGGIDSALSAAVAVDALGAERVWCVMMPSPYTSPESLEDAAEVARLLGCRLESVSIAPAMEAYEEMLGGLFSGTPADITEENIQSRARGMILMALSNKFGPMVLSTGNKSEMSVGYATLYGDMCGGYSVLKDVYKTTVFALSEWRNTQAPEGGMGPSGPVMPQRVISKPPTAELRPNQKDEDSLPPYAVLDALLFGFIEQQKSVSQVAAETGHPLAEVERVWTLLHRAEYKRRQAPPGVKITSRSFGRDRRYPITNAFTSAIKGQTT